MALIYHYSNNKDFITTGDKSIQDILKHIKTTKDFCGKESVKNPSIDKKDLIEYLVIPNNVVIYSINDNKIDGVLVFDIPNDFIKIWGICVSRQKSGIGSKLLKKVNKLALEKGIKKVKLTCYGEVNQFYKKNNYKVKELFNLSQDSDDSIDSNESLQKGYDMTLTPISSSSPNSITRRRSASKGGRRKKTKKTKKKN